MAISTNVPTTADSMQREYDRMMRKYQNEMLATQSSVFNAQGIGHALGQQVYREYAPNDAPAELYELAERAIDVAKERDIDQGTQASCVNLRTAQGLINEAFSEKQCKTLNKKIEDSILTVKRTSIRVRITDFIMGTGK